MAQRTRIKKQKTVYTLVASSSRLIRKVLAMLVIALLSYSTSYSQTVVKTNSDKVLKDTVIKTVTYKIYVGSRGGKYIIMTSKTTGNQYKRYLK